MARYRLVGDTPLKMGGRIHQEGRVVTTDHPDAERLVASGRLVPVAGKGGKAKDKPEEPAAAPDAEPDAAG